MRVSTTKHSTPLRRAKPNLAAAMRLSRNSRTPLPYFTGAGRDAARDRGTPWTGAAALAIVTMADKCIDHRICRFARSAFIPGSVTEASTPSFGPFIRTPSNKVGDAGAQMPVGGHLRRSEGRVGLFRLTPMIGNLGRSQASTLRAISVDTYRASASGSTLRPSST